MPNKYNLGAINIEFNPTTVKQNNMIVLEIGDSYKKEPVMQITGNNDIQLLYYYSRIFIYKLGSTNFFVIEMKCEKNPDMYFMFNVNVVVASSATHNNSTMGTLLTALNSTENKPTRIILELNSELKDQKIQRSGNIFYVKEINVSGAFPLVNAATVTFLPGELKEMSFIPTAGTDVQFVQEEIQWVLDCKHLGEDGKETADLAIDKSALKYFISGIIVGVGFIFIYLLVKYSGFSVFNKKVTGKKPMTWTEWWNKFFTGNLSSQTSLIST